MNPNNPFGMEIDDDGLPKYSPDRKNIAAYHMYKLGLTDKLPDPEESHTPFFRTPSYYAEKAQRERQAQAGLSTTFEGEQARPDPPGSDMTDLYKGRPFDVGGEGVNPPASRQKPFVPDTNAPYGQMGQAGQQVEKGQNSQPPLDTKAFGRQVLEHIFGERRPPYQNPSPDFRLSGQTSPAPIREEPAAPAQGQATPSPVRSQPVQRQQAVRRPAQVPTQPENTTSRPSETAGTGDTAHTTSLVENVMNTINQAFGQFNNAATEDDIREVYGYPGSKGSDGQTEDTGKTTGFSDSSQQTSPDYGNIPLPAPQAQRPLKSNKLPRGIRNNNPGNLDFVGMWKNSGATREDGGTGRFAVFKKPEDGLRALAVQLKRYANAGEDTIYKIISKYAPVNENNTTAYMNAVSRQLNAGIHEKLNLGNPECLKKLMGSVIQHENGYNPYSSQMIFDAARFGTSHKGKWGGRWEGPGLNQN